MQLECIFSNKPLNTRTTTYEFFVVVYLFVRSKASGCTHVAWYCHKRSQEMRKLTENEAFTVKLLQMQSPHQYGQG